MSHCDPLLEKEKEEDSVFSEEGKARLRFLSSVFPAISPFHQDKTLMIFLIVCALLLIPSWVESDNLWLSVAALTLVFLGFRFCRNRSVASFEHHLSNVHQNPSISHGNTPNVPPLSTVLFYEYAYGVMTGVFGLFVTVLLVYGCAHFTEYRARQTQETAWRVP